jgi:hypothetical protein
MYRKYLFLQKNIHLVTQSLSYLFHNCRILGAICLLAQEVEVLQGAPQHGGPTRHPPLLCQLHCGECQGERLASIEKGFIWKKIRETDFTIFVSLSFLRVFISFLATVLKKEFCSKKFRRIDSERWKKVLIPRHSDSEVQGRVNFEARNRTELPAKISFTQEPQ